MKFRNSKSFLMTVAASVSLAGSSLALADEGHVDIYPNVQGGQIQIGGFDFDENSVEFSSGGKAFGAEFGEDDPAQPFYGEDPGMASGSGALGTGLSDGSAVSFNVLGALTYWDGTGLPSFGVAPSGESLFIERGSLNMIVSGASGFQTGFVWDTVDTFASNEVHGHLSFFLLGSDMNPVPAGSGLWGSGDGIEPAAGVYFLPLQLTTDQGGIAASDPFYVVFNAGLDEVLHDQAVDFAASAVPTPEPLTAGLVGLGAMALLGGLRRRRA